MAEQIAMIMPAPDWVNGRGGVECGRRSRLRRTSGFGSAATCTLAHPLPHSRGSETRGEPRPLRGRDEQR